ncbi:Chk1 protein kinase [Vermiconidia calcicola]|uniref:Chk1 protein kinase n=1 Tax=Vermiconidia calcicola TaxID=1690605 RepID=A0ACC3MZC9_9PEZI|nr:Chk1 protein kinase [Vermiconidia calcicola]
MGGPPGSQVAPLPAHLPFRLVSKTIGSGAYASIRKAIPLREPGPVIAVKFINKEHAFRAGRLRPKQLHLELGLHKSVCPHDNIIRFLTHGEDTAWVWMALELAEGGDLFDKIEADEGVGEDVAHFYFTQLCSAISWCHSKGVAHRDIKPENMLLDGDGNLKLADFGLATQFHDLKTGGRKICGMVCGSPPYIAPEILAVGNTNHKRKSGEDKIGYDPQMTDIWSCAIVLFVLLVGNTPWDLPVMQESYEYHDYVTSKGKPQDDLWTKVPNEALSLVRGMLKVSTTERFTMHDIRKHPWFTRRNQHLNEKGKAANSVNLATQMLESLRIDFSAEVPASQQKPSQGDAMDIDSQPGWSKFASTQPEAPAAEIAFDWETPPRLGAGVSASQPLTNHDRILTNLHHDLLTQLSEDPSMSQFSATPSVPLSLTQQAQQFKDIVPSHSLARFLSILTFAQLLPMLLSALHRLNVPVAAPPQSAMEGKEPVVSLRIKTLDARQQLLQGNIVVEKLNMQTQGGGDVLEVRFIKAKGDPLGWRRMFKQVAILCKDGIVVPH